jgi:hypothetical protein
MFESACSATNYSVLGVNLWMSGSYLLAVDHKLAL